MCRHLAWIGRPRTLASLTVDPEYGLLRQSWAPRRMRHGTINADGFGAGWYAPAARAEPAVYRRAVPMWTDASFASLAGVISSGCVLAAVRSATPGMPVEETATAPFSFGPVLLSHNGRVRSDAVTALLAKEPEPVPPGSACDAALLAALLFTRLAAAAGAGPPPTAGAGILASAEGQAASAEILAGVTADVVRDVAAADPAARLNLLATDGAVVVATTWGDTLSYRSGPDGTEVASEPGDDGVNPDGSPARPWTDVDDHTLLVANETGVTLCNLT